MEKVFVYILGHIIAIMVLIFLSGIIVIALDIDPQSVASAIGIIIPLYFLIRFSIKMVQRRRSR